MRSAPHKQLRRLRAVVQHHIPYALLRSYANVDSCILATLHTLNGKLNTNIIDTHTRYRQHKLIASPEVSIANNTTLRRTIVTARVRGVVAKMYSKLYILYHISTHRATIFLGACDVSDTILHIAVVGVYDTLIIYGIELYEVDTISRFYLCNIAIWIAIQGIEVERVVDAIID